MNTRWYIKFIVEAGFLRKKVQTGSVTSIFEVDYNSMIENGVKLIVFDFDDTLGEFHAENLQKQVVELLQGLIRKELKIYVFSNCSEKRAKLLVNIFSSIQIPIISGSDKPSPRGFLEVLIKEGLSSSEAAVIGDRIGTDLYGGFSAKYSKRILVKPFSEVFGGKKAGFFDRQIKSLEKLLLK